MFNTVERSRNQKGVLLSPQRADNARKKIIEKSKRYPDKRDKQISIRPFEYILRCTHHLKNIRTQDTGNNSDSDRHHHRELQTDGYVTAHRAIIPRSKLLCHGNTEPSATSVAEPQDKEYHRCAGPYRSQRINTQKLSNDCRIDKRVRLLQQIAKQKRQCKL